MSELTDLDAPASAQPTTAGAAAGDIPTNAPPGAMSVHFRTLAEAMPALVFISEEASRHIYTNVRYQEYTGKPAAELLGHGWKACVHSDDLDELAGKFGLALDAGASVEHEMRLLLSVVRTFGTTRGVD